MLVKNDHNLIFIHVALRIKIKFWIGPSSLLEEAKKSIAVDIIDLTDDGEQWGKKGVFNGGC